MSEKKTKANGISKELDTFENSIKKWEMDEDEIFDEFTAPKQIPVVKEKKYIQMIPVHVEVAKSIRNVAENSSDYRYG